MNDHRFLLPEERIDDLQYNGLKVIQNPNAFCFGTDAVILSSFATVKVSDTVVDLGTGCGVMLLLISGRTAANRLIGVEIQAPMADMASRSVAMNDLSDRIEIHNLDLTTCSETLGVGFADIVVCNPPYGKVGNAYLSENPALRIARHEVCCTLEDCVKTASLLLKSGGKAAFIHQSDRVTDLLCLLRQYKLEPKRMRMVLPRAGKPPNLMLVEGVKLGKPGVHWLSPLIIWGDDGKHTPELLEIYHML